VSPEDQKIALGMRQTEANPWDTVGARYPVGTRISGAVRNFTSYGAFVELEDGIDGMIHVSDMSWTRKVNHPSEVLEKGQVVDAIVLEVDSDNKRISLGLKQASADPWSTISERYQIGRLVTGKVSKIATFGAFIELEEGVDGLVHISQISDAHIEKVRDALEVGQEVEARVIKIDQNERRIGLSIKAKDMADDEFERQREELQQSDVLRPGEDMVDLAGAFDQAFSGLEEWHPGDSKNR
jgi:small subunit ribosomal protein S1